MTTRKAFLSQLACGSFLIALAGCGGGGDEAAAPAPGPTPAPGSPPPSPPPPPPPTTCAAFTFSANHGHSLIIPLADLDSTTAKTYNVQGTSGHNHTVILSPAQLAQLKAGMIVSVATSADAGHMHQMGGGCS